MPSQDLEAEATPPESRYQPYKVWYLVFSKSKTPLPWWMKIFMYRHDKMFEHVSIVGPCGDSTIFIDPTPECIDIAYSNVPLPTKELIHVRYPENITVRFIQKPESARILSNIVPSCVSVCKAVLGLDKCIITPYGLYNYAMKNGGERIEL